jgi:hypothetical protein
LSSTLPYSPPAPGLFHDGCEAADAAEDNRLASNADVSRYVRTVRSRFDV